MAPFQYQGFINPYAPTISELMAHQNDPYARAAVESANANARAREVSGQAWGRAAENIGQLPLQIQQEQRLKAQQESVNALRQQEIERGTLQNAGLKRAAQGQQMLAGLIQQHSGENGVNYEAVASELAKQFPDEAARYLKTANDNEEASAQIRLRKKSLADAETLAIGQAAHKAEDPNDFMLRIDGLVAQGDLTKQHRDQILQAGQTQPWDAFKKRAVDAADSIAKPITQKADERVLTGVSGTPIVPEFDKGAKTDTEWAAVLTDPTKTPAERQHAKDTLAEMRKQKNPPTLDEQYTEAVAKGDTASAQNIMKTWKDKAIASRDPNVTAQLESIRALTQREAQARLDDRDVASPKNQQKFEQEYRTVLQRAMSSRSGGVGLEDAKVQQSNHLLALMDQNYDPKTGEYNIPQVQYQELALGMAKLLSGTGTVGEGLKNDLVQATASGDLKKVATYLTGKPFNGSTQDVFKMLKDSIERQGEVGMQNREGEMNYLRGLAPTDLAEPRRLALEATSLNPLRKSRLATDTSGNKRLFVSIDGGKTWK